MAWNIHLNFWAAKIYFCFCLTAQLLLLSSVSPGAKWGKKIVLLGKVFWYPAVKKFQEFIITILLILPLLSFSDLLYWSNDPLILFCWLYRWSFKAAVKCAIKSSRQLTGLIYKQMQPVINKRLKWSNGWESFYIKSSNLLSLSPQPSEPLMLQDTGLRMRNCLLFPLLCIHCFCKHDIYV